MYNHHQLSTLAFENEPFIKRIYFLKEQRAKRKRFQTKFPFIKKEQQFIIENSLKISGMNIIK